MSLPLVSFVLYFLHVFFILFISCRAEAIVDQINDIVSAIGAVHFNRDLDADAKAAAIEKMSTEKLPGMLVGLVSALGGKTFFFDKVSIADFALYGFVEGLAAFVPTHKIIKDIAPELAKVVEGVSNLPELANYFAKREGIETAEAAAAKTA